MAGQVLPEPYVPGSGDRLPAELRLVLAGYVGLAGGMFAGGLACAAAAVLFFLGDLYDPDDDMIRLLLLALASVVGPLVLLGLFSSVGLLELFKARSRFSTLLRRPSDQRMATVVALKRGGRTLILDIPWDGPGRGYQPLSEVRLALWMKAGMLVPGERVTVYGGPGGENSLLISSAQRARAFLGTMKARSTVQPGPVAPLDERVSGSTLVDWAAWAAATTFSYTGLGSSYDTAEVEAFRSAVRDAFLGVGEPPVRSDDVRGKQFSTHRPGYDKTQVDAFVEAAGLRLAAMESTDRPSGPLVSVAILARWAAWADSTTFPIRRWTAGYDTAEVDAFLDVIRDTFHGIRPPPMTWPATHNNQFTTTRPGYDVKQVDAFLDKAEPRLAAIRRNDPVSGILTDGLTGQTQQDFQPPRWAEWAEWAEWADSTRFSTITEGSGYDTAEVDAFRQEIRDTFLGIKQPPLTSDEANDKRFRMARRGYDVQQVDAFCDEAEEKLAAMRPTYRGRRD
jgi:DivIVA domain-containing protein